MSNTNEMRKLIETINSIPVIEAINPYEQSSGPMDTLRYIKIYLTTYKDIGSGDIENILMRVKHALDLIKNKD